MTVGTGFFRVLKGFAKEFHDDEVEIRVFSLVNQRRKMFSTSLCQFLHHIQLQFQERNLLRRQLGLQRVLRPSIIVFDRINRTECALSELFEYSEAIDPIAIVQLN